MLHSVINRFSENFSFWPCQHKNQINYQLDEGSRKKHFFIFFLLFLFYAFSSYQFINNALWQDELYSLKNFILVPTLKTLSDYHSTNNHIVFSFLSNLYLKALGVFSLTDLLKQPALIRSLPFTIGLITLPLLYNRVKKIFSPISSLIVATLYAGSLQPYEFNCQVRGYSLDILLSVVIITSILIYPLTKKGMELCLSFTAAFLLLLNLPAAIYYIIAIGLVLLFRFLFKIKLRSPKSAFRTPELKLMVSFFAAGLAVAIFFFFKKDQLTQNTFLAETSKNVIDTIKQPLTVLYRFLDWKIWLLVPIAILAKKNFVKVKLSLFFIALLILPFLLFILHNPPVILRIWIVLLPVFCLFLTQILESFIQTIKTVAVFATVSVLAISLSLLMLKRQIIIAHANSEAPLDLRYQYHLFNFNPDEVSNLALDNVCNKKMSFVLYDQHLGGISYYLLDKKITLEKKFQNQSDTAFFISDNSTAIDSLGLAKPRILDSGKNNSKNFYKWYLIAK